MSNENVIEIVTSRGYQGRARREAALLLEEIGMGGLGGLYRETTLDLMALAWLKGADHGVERVQALIEAEAARLAGKEADDDPAA